MLPLLALGLLLLTAIFGLVLAAFYLGAGAGFEIHWPVGSVHGALGVAGLVTLIAGLAGPPRGVAMGVGAFGRIAAVLLALALAAGLTIMVIRLRSRRLPVLLVAMHLTIAITGIVILAAYALVS